jgi:hypothetical protein
VPDDEIFSSLKHQTSLIGFVGHLASAARAGYFIGELLKGQCYIEAKTPRFAKDGGYEAAGSPVNFVRSVVFVF